MTVGLFANPGQTITLAVEVLDGDGYRTDGYSPTLDFVRTPSGGDLSGLPATMVRDSLGLYTLSIAIPTGLAAIGTYIASASWTHPTSLATVHQLYLINVALPFGTASATPA